MRTLVALCYSPWSNKAQWALDVAGLDYEVSSYTPMISETGLRLKLRRAGVRVDKVTVPVLFEKGRPPLTDSLDIARRAAESNPDAGLFPAGREAEVERWNARADGAMQAARALVTASLKRMPAALVESVPRIFQLPLMGPMIARTGAAYFSRKYALPEGGEAEMSAVAEVLDAWRAALDGRPQLYDRVSYADLAMAVVLHAVEPPAEMVVGHHSRAAWRQPELAARFADLVAWRDALIARHPPQWQRLAG